MAASYQNRDVQKRRATDFAISFTTSIYLDGEKSFDILQGLLVHMAWYGISVEQEREVVTNCAQVPVPPDEQFADDKFDTACYCCSCRFGAE